MCGHLDRGEEFQTIGYYWQLMDRKRDVLSKNFLRKLRKLNIIIHSGFDVNEVYVIVY